MGLTVGAEVTVSPSTGGPAVAGILHGNSANHVALMRNDDQVGQICVNFPRLGYRVNVRD